MKLEAGVHITNNLVKCRQHYVNEIKSLLQQSPQYSIVGNQIALSTSLSNQ